MSKLTLNGVTIVYPDDMRIVIESTTLYLSHATQVDHVKTPAPVAPREKVEPPWVVATKAALPAPKVAVVSKGGRPSLSNDERKVINCLRDRKGFTARRSLWFAVLGNSKEKGPDGKDIDYVRKEHKLTALLQGMLDKGLVKQHKPVGKGQIIWSLPDVNIDQPERVDDEHDPDTSTDQRTEVVRHYTAGGAVWTDTNTGTDS